MKTMKIIKRSGQEVEFDISKIENAIRKASQAVDYRNALSEGRIKLIAREAEGVSAKREEREIRLRDCAARIIHHNRRIRDAIIRNIPFYLGDPSAAEPPREQCLEELLNPKSNGAYRYLSDFGEAAKAYRRGECPHEVLPLLLGSTLHVIQNCLEPIRRHKTYNIAVTVVVDFYNYLITPCTLTTQEEHGRRIDEHIERMQRRFCQNADVGYELTSEILERREELRRQRSAWRHTRKTSRTGLHGTRTKMMRKQFADFKEFVKANPIVDHNNAKTTAARANQFWVAHENTFKRAAQAKGEKRGYARAQDIASAYRTSKS